MAISFGSAGAITSSVTATTLTPVLPTNNSGDALMVMIAKNSSSGYTTPSGWVLLNQTIPSTTTFNCGFFIAISNGAMTNPTFSWSTSAACAAQAFQFTGANGGFGTQGGAQSGTANPHTSSSIKATYQNSLVVAVDYQLSMTAQGTTPTGWTGLWANGDTLSGISFAGWSIALATIGSASGAISVNEGAVAWVQHQHELISDLYGQICI